MDFIEDLQKVPMAKNEDVEYLKQSELPLVLYGAADLGRNVKRFLEINNVKVDFVVVDKEYWQPNMKLSDYVIQPIENILANNFKFNIVVAFYSGFAEKIARLKENAQIQRCLFFHPLNVAFVDCYHDSDFLNRHSTALTDLYSNLTDDLSRRIMLEYIKARKSANSTDLVKLNVPNELQCFPDFLPLADNEIFVDCGAFNGDTIKVFLNKTNGKYNKIFAFEPDTVSAQQCRELLANQGREDVLFEKGAWSGKAMLRFDNRGNMTSVISEKGNIQIELDSIDSVLGDEKATFIKMDIEGAEFEALKGAQNQIIANKPKLAICVYHKQEDLITIPQYILSLNPDYKLYLRHYGAFCTELVLYAI
ncbi:MAG: FkbM family methyltransferase [Chitinivibrionia bacterium]|nr:FkbM family methyltransferase [Chitinivibrionia bacterium]